MAKLRRDRLLFLGAIGILIAGGYIFFRYTYKVSDEFPFSQELILVFLGAIVTVLITAALLNKQTEVELQKEEAIKYIDLKSQVYMKLIDHIEDVLLSGEASDADIMKLRFLNHKIALVSSPGVLMQFESFIRTFMALSQDKQLVPAEADEVMRELARLTVAIRSDLLGSVSRDEPYTAQRIAEQIERNNADLESPRAALRAIQRS